MPAQHHLAHDDVWSLSGTFTHWIYGPKGEAQGLMLDVNGTPVQFVVGPHEAPQVQALQEGQQVELEGTWADAEADHEVYHLTGVSQPAVNDGDASPESPVITGIITRLNYAKHGQVNGVVLDTGDFVHTRPHGFDSLDLKVGDHVTASGQSRPLFNGLGVVVEATEVNGVVID